MAFKDGGLGAEQKPKDEKHVQLIFGTLSSRTGCTLVGLFHGLLVTAPIRGVIRQVGMGPGQPTRSGNAFADETIHD